ncbi:uncharacterized protein LTR77_008610 [Saxophila tyrrhenica]|uniref:Uncharacterized protein n=1 Tax=Saxophila tyrrhenica TaxID=1690608 RepID=A0AAV9P2K6_9PEZI|nr:hypothetical protein LTR77_008610 [Saxophila tyrrhenica]
MPDLQRAPGGAETDGSHSDGYRALEKAFRDSWAPKDDALLSRSLSFSNTRYPDLKPSMPAAWPESPSIDGSSSDVQVHEGFENIAMPPPRMQARALHLDDSGMPPTPPTMNNSDGADTLQEHRASPPPVFADDLRNALESKASGLSTTPVNAVSPPTPDPSPPATLEAQPVMAQKEQAHFLHPMLADRRTPHFLKHHASSKAESFRTAREDQPLSPGLSTSQAYLPENDRLPDHWLENTRDLQLAGLGLSDTAVSKTPKAPDAVPLTTVSSRSSRRKSKHESPPQTRDGPGEDWEKHISYVSGPDELEEEPATREVSEEQRDEQPPAAGLGLSGAGIEQEQHTEPEHSVEDVNNMVYKRIREENVKRHSAISNNSAAITVGIYVPPSESTPHTLKRQTKCLLLRGDGGPESNRGSFDGDIKPLSYKKARMPERQKKLDDSPVFESSIRQVSSPARLGPDTSNMTALTYATSPNTWVASLHEAEPPVDTPPRTPPKRVPNPERVGHNVGVKRNSVGGAKPSRVLEKSSHQLRGVIPSVDTEPEEWSPPSGKLRRFSREERLENNGDVRRTSVGSSKDAGRDHSSEGRKLSSDKTITSSPERSFLPTSPRKSLDARFLHPTTTPMSTSQFSDRTVEVCEASGVRIYPHNNDSLLVVQHGSRPVSKDKSTPTSRSVESQLRDLGEPIFAAQVDPPTPTLGATDSDEHADSPLTNPRTAPEPPVIKFIPPTPCSELERQLTLDTRPVPEPSTPQRRLSLLQKARRYSDSLFARSSVTYRPSPPHRDVHLSPLWRPQYFWDDFDSDEEEFLDDFEAPGTLPKGGDTSEVTTAQTGGKGIFPRAMSKRLPGFRGKGGFLVGNSLGIERHGTNARRHYVGTVERRLDKRESEEVLRKLPQNTRHPQAGPLVAEESKGGKRVFVVPFSGGKRAQWVGPGKIGAMVERRRERREEREAEARREKLRGLIGGRVAS